MRQTTQQVRESILNIDDIKDQLNLLVHEIRSFSARIDEMQSSPLGLKYGFDCTYDYFFRMRDLKSKTKGIKTPNKPVILLVLMILECLKTGPRSERDIKDFVTEKCKKCGIKATNRGTIAGANLEISSACNILGAMGILEQAHVDDRVEPDLFINPALPDPPSDEGKIEDYLSLLAYRWSKIIESVVTESQTMEIASSASINQDKTSVTANNTLIPPVKTEVQQHQSQTLPLSSSFNQSANPPNSKEMTPVPSQHSHDDMDFVDILMQSSEHLDLPSSHPDNYSHTHTLYPNHNQSLQTHLPLLNGESKEAMHPFAPNDYSMPLHPTNNNFILQNQTNPSEHDHSYRASDINLREGLNVPEYSDLSNATALMGQDLTKATTLTTGNKPSGMTRKSASSTKIWKIKRQLARNRLAPVSASTTTSTSYTTSGKDKNENNGSVNDDEVTRFLFTPDAFLEKWGENSFRHHASLEVEEKLLRRLASQCSLGFRSKEVTLTPSHVGTRYLDNHYDVSNSEVVPTISQVQPPLTAAPSSSSKGTKSGQRSKSSSSRQTQHPATSQNERDTAVDKTMTGTGASDFLDTSLLSISTHQSSDSLDVLNDNASQSITNGGNTTSSSKNREYDFTANVTAQMLIDKVKKSKRHRGNSLANLITYSSSNTSSTSSGVNQLTSVALNNLKNICQSSVQGYWGSDITSNQRKATSSSSSSLSTPAASNSSEMHSEEREEKEIKSGATSVAEYVRSCQHQNINITNQFLNSHLFHAQAQQLLVNGTAPNLNLNLFRHYVTPLSILDYDKIATTSPNTASVGGPIRYPDVMITTLEIPWKAIVSEFQVVRSEEMGLSLIDTSSTEVHRSYSYSDISPNHNQALPSNTQPSSSSKTSKQKSDRVHRSASFDSSSIQHLSNHTAQPSATPVNSTILRCRSVSEVIAPAFREINHNSTNSQNDVMHSIPSNDDVGIAIDRSMSISPAPPLPLRESDTSFQAEQQGDDVREDSDEDTSDEAYLSKHDHVLRTMREKWALMQQLKLETRREMMMQGQGPTSHHKRSYSFQSPFKAQKLPHSQSNDHLVAQPLSQPLTQQNEEEEGEGGVNGVAMTEGGSDSVSPMAQSEGSPLDGTTSLLGGLISYNSRKRSYSLLNISKIGEVASQLVNGGTSSSATSSVGGVEGGSGVVPAVAVKKRGRPPKIQKTSHLHYGKINS